MNISDFLTKISFHSIQPMTPLPAHMFFATNFELESSNTAIPVDSETIKANIKSIWEIPKMSTFAIGAVINQIVSSMPTEQAYVNVGVWHGFTFLSGIVNNAGKTCIGIDNFSEFGGPKEYFSQKFHQHKSENHHFYEMDYVEYFKQVHKESIGCYLFDGPHDYQNQLLALQIAEPFFADGCIILVDDTNWPDPRKATLDFIASRPNSYRVIMDVPTVDNGHPTFWNGLIIFQKIK